MTSRGSWSYRQKSFGINFWRCQKDFIHYLERDKTIDFECYCNLLDQLNQKIGGKKGGLEKENIIFHPAPNQNLEEFFMEGVFLRMKMFQSWNSNFQSFQKIVTEMVWHYWSIIRRGILKWGKIIFNKNEFHSKINIPSFSHDTI